MSREFWICVLVIGLLGFVGYVSVKVRGEQLSQVKCVDASGKESYSSMQIGWTRLRNGTYIDRIGHVFRPPRGVECGVERQDYD